MKTGFTAVLVLLLLAAAVTATWGTEANWRLKVVADNNEGQATSTSYFGTYPTSSDGYDVVLPIQDAQAAWLYAPGGAVAAWCSGLLAEDTTKAYFKDIKAPIVPPTIKTWDLRVYALVDATYSDIRLRCLTVGSLYLPPASFSGTPASYYLRMIDNRGVSGAPANGTVWSIPIPTAHSTTVPFFELVLPVLKVNTASDQGMANAGGYVMEYGHHVCPIIPERSSLLAFACGLGALGGLVWRRR